MRLIKNGASAYISKKEHPDELIKVLRQVLSGKKHFTIEQKELMTQIFIKSEEISSDLDKLLTDREFQVMFMLAMGLNKSEIAEKLSVSINTISNHRYNILKKMHLSSNAELVRYAIHHGIIK